MSGRRSNNKSNNNGGGSGGGVVSSAIPATCRKMVQSLKEIVNCPEDEIYSMLKECNMDPNDTVNRLLSQDTFHEVKSKRDKKKEVKESPDSRPRGASTTSSRGGRGGATRYDGRSGSVHFNSSDPGVLRGKPAYKKENGADDLSSSSPSAYASTYGLPGNNNNRQPVSYSAVAADFKPLTTGTVSGISSSSNPSPGFQPAWVGAPGQVSMADIVKMGRRKASGTPNMLNDTSPSLHNAAAPATSNHNVSYPIAPAPLPQESQYSPEAIQESVPKVSEYIHETSGLESQHSSPEEWKLPEQPSAEMASIVEPSETAEAYTDPSIPSNLQSDKTWSDEFQGAERDIAEHSTENYMGSASASGRQIQSDNSGHTSHFDEDSYGNMNSYPPQRHTLEHHEGDGDSSQLSIPNYSVSPVDDVKKAASSAAANLQQLSLQEERGLSSAEVNPAVIIPNHLQIPTAECSHLSFGSFGSLSSNFPGSYASNSLKNNIEETSVAPNTSADHSVNRDPEYFGDEHIQLRSDGNAAPSADAGSYDSLPQSEVMRQEGSEAIHGHQYNFPTSVPGYALENNSQLNAAFPYEQTNSQMQSLAPLSSVMQAYSNSLQGNPMAPTDQPARESSDHAYSAFLSAQSMPTKYNTAGSSNGPSLSLPENMKSGMFSMPHPAGANIATGPALPQHLAVHPYSQPTLPLGFTNMIGYPFLPQSYAYMPPAYQQAYAGNSTYHQSPAAVHNAGMKYTLPQYKSNVSVSSLPQSASAASAYGGFGSSVNIPGSFQLNPSTTTSSTSVGYDDLMSSQYKESNHFHPLQQNDSGVWVQGLGSRPVSALPASTYYSFQGQGQQHNGFRQGQQPSQHYGNLGYQNFYHSQAGVTQEHQQQPPNDGALSGSQGAQSKQSHQMWQHSY